MNHTLNALWQQTLDNRWAYAKDPDRQSSIARRFVSWSHPGPPLCSELGPTNLTYYRQTLSGKASTINRNMGPVITMMREGINLGWVRPEVLNGYTPLKEEQDIRQPITEEDRNALRALLRPEHQRLFDFLLDTGMRAKEAINLRRYDIHLDRRCVELRADRVKNRKGRTVPLTARAEAILLEGDQDRDPFEGLRYRTFMRDWDKARKALGKDTVFGFTPHALRHTCATELKRRGVPLDTIRLWLGHSNIATTQIYVHTDQDDLDAARDALEA